MSLKTFLKDKFIFIIIHFFVISFIVLLLYAVNLNSYAIWFIAILLVLSNIVVFLIELFRKQFYYNSVKTALETLDKKYLLSELINEPQFAEGKFLFEIFKITNKSMNDEIAKYSLSSKEYREYIETWVHEIKTPIASSKLIIENNQNDATKRVDEEIDKIEEFVLQALFYSKSNSVEKDYIIKEIKLKDMVNQVIRRNAKSFIENKISVEIKDLDYIVYSDIKWADFIISQIIGNAIKYKKEDPKISIYGKENENSISLFISDNGIGIQDKDLARVFEKGFTGENGRKFAKATGIGLYLCKKLCDKLGLNIRISSIEGKKTMVEIVFPKSKFTILES